METIYYKIHTIWCRFPFQDVIDEKYVKFYRKVKNKYIMIPQLEIESNTSIEEKKEYIRKELNIKRVNIIKIK